MESELPAPVRAIQSLTLTLAVAAIPLMALVVRAIMLVNGPQSQEVFAENPGPSDLAATLISIGLGYGVPVAVFGLGYAVAGYNITRRRRLAFVLSTLLSIAGILLCITLVSQLLQFVAIALGLFQAVLLVLLAASVRYFWSASPAPAEPSAAADSGEAEASPVERPALTDAGAGPPAPAPVELPEPAASEPPASAESPAEPEADTSAPPGVPAAGPST